jgi:hypothetical protein
MAKQESTTKTKEKKISVCDVMKSNTSKSIKKLESQIPSLVQQYSDLYSAYLHSFDDIFGTCYIAEKEFFDKLGIDEKTLKTFEEFSDILTRNHSTQVDAYANFLRTYVQMRISAIETFDNYVHIMMDSYSKVLSQVNSAIDKASEKVEKKDSAKV